jgi:heme/copper-type cytochrome/quinol oxidase subunit 2
LNTLAVVLTVVLIGVSVLILLIVILIIAVCVWKRCGRGTYRPQQTEIDQGVKLEGEKQKEESDSATAANQ